MVDDEKASARKCMQKPGNSGYLPRSSSYNTIVILIEGGRGRIISIKYLIFTSSQASFVILRGAAPPPLAGSFFFFAFAQRKKDPLDGARFNTEAYLPPHLGHAFGRRAQGGPSFNLKMMI